MKSITLFILEGMKLIDKISPNLINSKIDLNAIGKSLKDNGYACIIWTGTKNYDYHYWMIDSDGQAWSEKYENSGKYSWKKIKSIAPMFTFLSQRMSTCNSVDVCKQKPETPYKIDKTESDENTKDFTKKIGCNKADLYISGNNSHSAFKVLSSIK